MPAFAGMTIKQPCDLVAATRGSVRALPIFPLGARGWRAEKRKPCRIALPYGARGRLSARHSSDLPAAGPRFRLRSTSFAEIAQRSCQVVSQLLAGTLSGPGRGPGAARVPGSEPGPQGTAPRPAFTTPPGEAGISFMEFRCLASEDRQCDTEFDPCGIRQHRRLFQKSADRDS
jgi:hypothetical protein